MSVEVTTDIQAITQRIARDKEKMIFLSSLVTLRDFLSLAIYPKKI